MTEWVGLLPSEPFRVFFPVGLVAGVVGVALWPMLYAGWLTFYPNVAHARMMIEGFAGAFVLGFLGTAAPRMLEAPRLRPWELGWLAVLHGAMLFSHFTNHVMAGDAFFLLELISMAGMLGARACFLSADHPPAGFLLVAFGFVSAISGLILLLVEPLLETNPFRFQLARLLLYEGFLLMPIVGIGGFLFPRFFVARPSSETPKRRSFPALEAFLCGVLLFLSFGLEAAGFLRSAGLLRLFTGGTYLLRNVSFLRRSPEAGTLATSLRLAFLCVFIGLVAGGFLPSRKIALEHFLFIGGFGLLTFSVATRVLLGHGGRLPVAMGKLVSIRWIAGLILAALFTRVVADFVPKILVSHHNYAALCWAAASIVWGILFLPLVRWADIDNA